MFLEGNRLSETMVNVELPNMYKRESYHCKKTIVGFNGGNS